MQISKKSLQYSEIDQKFEVVNGLPGVKRNVLLHLTWLLWFKTDQIRLIIGMCCEHFQLKTHSLFILKRPINIPVLFRAQKDQIWQQCDSSNGEKQFTSILSNDYDFRMIFLDNQMAKDIFHWAIRIKYSFYRNAYMNISAVPSVDVDNCLTCRHFSSAVCGGCSFQFAKVYGCLQSRLCGTKETPFLNCLSPVPDNSLVAIEADMHAHTVTFFVNELKLPFVVTGVRGPLYFGVTGVGKSSFTSVLYRRLAAPTPPEPTPKEYAVYTISHEK